MSNIDKIRQEIERLIRMNQTKNGFPAGTNCVIRIEAYEHLIPFLDTLPEQPVEIDVDKKWDELQRYFRDINEAFEEGKKSTAKKPEQPVGWDDENAADKKAVKEIVKTVHKEATRQVKEMVKEQPASESSEKIGQLNVLPKSARHSEGLEEAAENIYKTPFGTRSEDFKAGAEWGAKHLKK